MSLDINMLLRSRDQHCNQVSESLFSTGSDNTWGNKILSATSSLFPLQAELAKKSALRMEIPREENVLVQLENIN